MITPKIRFNNFEEEYLEIYLKDCAHIVRGGTPKTNISKYWNGTINWFIPTEIKTKYIGESNRKITHEGVKDACATILPINTILLTTRAKIGESSILKEPGCTNQGFQSLIVKDDYSHEYLYYQLKTKIDILKKLSIGSTFNEINRTSLEKLKLETPSLEEQKEIAAFLSLVDLKLEKKQKKLELLKLYKRGLINNIFRIDVSTSLMFSDLYLEAKEGGTPLTEIESYYKGGNIPFVKIEDLNNKYLTNVNSFITQEGLDNSSAWLVPKNSVLFSNGATIGAISINTFEVSTKQGILGIIPNPKYCNEEILYYFLTSSYFQKELSKVTTKGTMLTAYLKDMNNIIVPNLNTITQKQIDSIKLIDRLIERENNQYQILNNIKKSLLDQMFI